MAGYADFIPPGSQIIVGPDGVARVVPPQAPPPTVSAPRGAFVGPQQITATPEMIAAEQQMLANRQPFAPRPALAPIEGAAARAAKSVRGGGILPTIAGLATAYGANRSGAIDPEDTVAAGALGYGAAKAAAPVVRGALPFAMAVPGALKLAGRFLGPASIPLPAWSEAYMASQQDRTPEYARRFNTVPSGTIGGDLGLQFSGAVDKATLGIPGFVNKGIDRALGYGPARPGGGSTGGAPSASPIPLSAGESTPQYPDRAGAFYGNDSQAPVASPPASATTLKQRSARPALAPPDALPVIQPQQIPQAVSSLSTQSDAIIRQAQADIEGVNRRFEEYKQQTGMVTPKEMSAMDKFSILAKALGVGVVMASFPGLGVLAGLGGAAVVGAQGYQKKKGALANDAVAQRKRMDDVMGADLTRSKQVQGALGDIMQYQGGREDKALDREQTGLTRAENARQFDRTSQLAAYRERRLAQEAARTGGQLIRDKDGQLVLWNPHTGEKTYSGEKGSLANARGGSYDMMDNVKAIADKIYKEKTDAGETADYAAIYNSLAGQYGVPALPGGGAPTAGLPPGWGIQQVQ